jgi:hypothetical protein
MAGLMSDKLREDAKAGGAALDANAASERAKAAMQRTSTLAASGGGGPTPGKIYGKSGPLRSDSAGPSTPGVKMVFGKSGPLGGAGQKSGGEPSVPAAKAAGLTAAVSGVGAKDKGDNTRMPKGKPKVKVKVKVKAKAPQKSNELPAKQLQDEARARRAKAAAASNRKPAAKNAVPSRNSVGRQNQPVVKQKAAEPAKKSTMKYDKGLGRMVDRGVSGLKGGAPNR